MQPSHPLRMIAGSGIGNIVEWYIFMVYAYLIPQISRLFFPTHSNHGATILALLIFAAGFLARPIGAVFFGWMGDRLGRKSTLVTSQVLMVLTTGLFAALPTYASWGSTAGVVMVVLRVLQGISIGGEYTTSLCYIVEVAPRHRRSLWASVISGSTALGILISAWVVFAAVHGLTESQLLAWGWRLCFGIGALLAVLGVYLRYRLPETPVFEDNRRLDKRGKLRDLVQAGILGRMLVLVVLGTAYAYCYQLFFVWVPNAFAQGEAQQATLLLMTAVVMLVFMAFIALGGYWADRFGQLRVLRTTLLLLLIIWWPLQHEALQHGMGGLCVFLGLNAVVFGSFVGVASAYFASLFPSPVRASALSLSYNVTYAIVGGLTPVVLALLLHRFGMGAVMGVSMAIVAVAWVVALLGPQDAHQLEEV